MIKIYGIPNCDSIKKARQWLQQNQLEYQFFDYKKQGVAEKKLQHWVEVFGWEVVLNKRGTTWRKLDENLKKSVDAQSSIQIMLNNPSAIKRPILEYNNQLLIGFKVEEYKGLL